jgi:hypothetical protein
MPYFNINNPHLFPPELKKYEFGDAHYPLTKHNLKILYSLKDKFYNCDESFLKYLKLMLGID